MTTANFSNYAPLDLDLVELEQNYTMAEGILACAANDNDLLDMCMDNVDRIAWHEDQTVYTFQDDSTIIMVLH